VCRIFYCPLAGVFFRSSSGSRMMTYWVGGKWWMIRWRGPYMPHDTPSTSTKRWSVWLLIKESAQHRRFFPLFSEGAEKGSMQRAEPNTCRVSREINFFTAPFYTLVREDIPSSQRVRCSRASTLKIYIRKFNKKIWVNSSCHHLQSCKIRYETNTCVRCNKKEKIMSYNRLFLTWTC
jgi:hypothetical protein